jgi:hypothetical protein
MTTTEKESLHKCETCPDGKNCEIKEIAVKRGLGINCLYMKNLIMNPPDQKGHPSHVSNGQ